MQSVQIRVSILSDQSLVANRDQAGSLNTTDCYAQKICATISHFEFWGKIEVFQT